MHGKTEAVEKLEQKVLRLKGEEMAGSRIQKGKEPQKETDIIEKPEGKKEEKEGKGEEEQKKKEEEGTQSFFFLCHSCLFVAIM